MQLRHVTSLLLLFPLCALPIVAHAQETVLPEIIIPENALPGARPSLPPLLSANTKEKISSLADQHFWTENFKELETAATTWRKNKEQLADGSWKLTAFYDTLSQVSTSSPDLQAWLHKIHHWRLQNPTSVTPCIVLASLYCHMAGQIYINDEDEKLLTQARLILREAKKLPDKDPHWWATTLNIGRLQAWDRATYDTVFNEAVAFEPEYNPYYFYKSRYLAHISDAEAAKFCQESADKRGEKRGDILYAHLIQFLADYEHETVHSPALSFDRVDRGYQAIDRLYRHNVELKISWANLCADMVQNEAARKARIRRLVAELEKLQPSPTARWRWKVKWASDWAFDKQKQQAN